VKTALGFGSIVLALLLATAASAPSGVTAATTRVSVSTAGTQGMYDSYAVGISGDGRFVAFTSDSPNLVAGDTNERRDAFVHDRSTGETTRVSVSSDGAQAKAGGDPFGGSSAVGISADGRYVAFTSDAPNLVAHDTNGAADVFVHDRATGRTTRISVSSGGRQARGESGSAAFSANGRYVAFTSTAPNLVAHDTNRAADVFLHDLRTGRTTRVSVSSAGRQTNRGSESSGPAIGANGRYVAFTSTATNLVRVKGRAVQFCDLGRP
jgi:Tol biopolymer transport system component